MTTGGSREKQIIRDYYILRMKKKILLIFGTITKSSPKYNAGESLDASAQNNFIDDVLQASFKELINWTFEETLKASIFIYL